LWPGPGLSIDSGNGFWLQAAPSGGRPGSARENRNMGRFRNPSFPTPKFGSNGGGWAAVMVKNGTGLEQSQHSRAGLFKKPAKNLLAGRRRSVARKALADTHVTSRAFGSFHPSCTVIKEAPLASVVRCSGHPRVIASLKNSNGTGKAPRQTARVHLASVGPGIFGRAGTPRDGGRHRFFFPLPRGGTKRR